MKYENVITGKRITVTGEFTASDGEVWVEYKRETPVEVDGEVLFDFQKPRYVLVQLYRKVT